MKYKHSLETRRRISSSLKERPKSEEHKQNLSKSRKGKYCGRDHPLFGVSRSQETKDKQRKSMLGKPAWNKKNIEEISKYSIECGYKCLSVKYVNNYSKLKFECLEGHRFDMSWDNFKGGARCPMCSKYRKKNIEEIKRDSEKRGYKCLSEGYVTGVKLVFRCPEGHIFKMLRECFQNVGQSCPICKNISTSERMVGERNPSWKGGTSYEPYCLIWNEKEFKEMVFERDRHECMNPICNSNSSRLVRHHVDYNKKNCCLSNVVILCNGCNSRSNFNREYWKTFYQSILAEKYSYSYY